MKRTLISSLLLALLLSIFSLSFAATTVSVGSGTLVDNYVPIRGSYAYSYTQQIYARSLINRAGDITKIRFFFVRGGMSNSSDWTIYMGHTTKTSLDTDTDWIPTSGLTQVFSGDISSLVPANNNWMEITLQTPFAYNNVDNLVIAVDENAPGDNAPTVEWGVFNSGYRTALGYFNYYNNPNPNNPPQANHSQSQICRLQLVMSDPPSTPVITYPLYSQAEMVNGQALRWTLPAGSEPATSYDVVIDGSTVSSNQANNYY